MQKNSTAIQLTVVIVLAMITLLGISTLLSLGLQPASVLAQGAISTPAVAFTPAPLSDFGFALDELVTQARDDEFDLAILKTTDVVSVTAGTRVTYTLTITNKGPDPAQYFYVYDNVPPQFTGIEYTFPAGVDALSNGDDNPQYLITSVLPDDGVLVVTVTGVLTSVQDVQVVNTAIVTPFVKTADTSGGNNKSDETVSVAGSNPLTFLYLPLVAKYPTPSIVLAYHETFDSGAPWFEDLGSNCGADHTGGIYQVDVDKSDRECMPPADNNDSKPEKPYRTYGEFEVQGYISEGQDADNAYGIWFDGKGGDTQYVFRLYPNIGSCSNGGKWEFLRRKPGANATLASNNCDTHIKRGYGGTYIQKIRVARKTLNEIKLYIDDTLIATINDTNPITGDNLANGVYVRADDVDIRVKFDNFKVFRYP